MLRTNRDSTVLKRFGAGYRKTMCLVPPRRIHMSNLMQKSMAMATFAALLALGVPGAHASQAQLDCKLRFSLSGYAEEFIIVLLQVLLGRVRQ